MEEVREGIYEKNKKEVFSGNYSCLSSLIFGYK